MARVLLISLFGMIGAVVGTVVALALLAAYRLAVPPGPMPMGDLESPAVIAAGFLVGFGAGCFLANIRLARADRTSANLDERPASKLLFASVRALCLGLLAISVTVAVYFSAWSGTGGWRFPFHVAQLIFFPLPLTLPYLAAYWLVQFGSRHNSLLLLWLVAIALMSVAFVWFHLPGNYQTISGGEPTGIPSGMYEINAIILGVVQWGIVLIATLAQAGYLLARRQSRIPKGKVG